MIVVCRRLLLIVFTYGMWKVERNQWTIAKRPFKYQQLMPHPFMNLSKRNRRGNLINNTKNTSWDISVLIRCRRKKADEIEARYREAKVEVDTLAGSILTRAFLGQLGANNPHEPSAFGLARIMAGEGIQV